MSTAATIAADAEAPMCPACGYDLRAIDSGRCPECGTAIDRSASFESRIPWTHRRQIGAWRAYFKTVGLAMLHPTKLAQEAARPVSFDDARRFSRRTGVLAWIPLAIILSWGWAASMRLPVVPRPMSAIRLELHWSGGLPGLSSNISSIVGAVKSEVGYPLSVGFLMEVLIVLCALAALFAWTVMIARVGGYFFHPRDLSRARQDRALALSHYICAPLALMPLALPMMAFTFWHAVLIVPGVPQIGSWWLTNLGWVAPALLLAWCELSLLSLLKRTTGCGWGRVLTMAVSLPVMWVVLAAVTVSIPAGLVLLGVIGFSVT